MSVLIKEMLMPHDCEDCYFCVDNTIPPKSICALLTKETDSWNQRPSWCPLIELPPHGRLIDADEFYKDINESILLTDGFKDAFNLWFDEQPTIIEAEAKK